MGPAEVEINQQTRQGSTAFTITNLTGRPVRARLLPRALQGADPSWISIAGPPEVPMAVGATITAPLNLAIPPTAAGGTYLVRMDVVPEDDTEAEVHGPSVSFVVPPAATPKRTPKWLLPLIIGLVVLVLLIGAGAFFVLRTSNAGGGPSPGPSTPGGGPRWADWQDLGGTYNSAPAVASWAANRLDWFALGPGNNMLHQGFDGPNPVRSTT